MAEIRGDQPLVPSVLDRLLDYEPEVKRELPKSRHQVLRDLKQSVRRDLENLLNSRQRCLAYPPALKELKQSLVNYGIPEFLGTNLTASQDRESFCRTLQTVVQQYEPRFKSVKVILLTNAEPLDRTLRFRIDALLYADPAPEPIIFDSMLEPASGSVAVKGVS
jgi:type VI secretion system protein ImpF